MITIINHKNNTDQRKKIKTTQNSDTTKWDRIYKIKNKKTRKRVYTWFTYLNKQPNMFPSVLPSLSPMPFPNILKSNRAVQHLFRYLNSPKVGGWEDGCLEWLFVTPRHCLDQIPQLCLVNFANIYPYDGFLNFILKHD